MKKKQLPYVIGPVVAAFILSCNVYEPFDSASSDQDFVELALKCLHKGDYACAVDNYSKITNATTKSEKLCTVNIGRAGFNLTALINSFDAKDQKVLGTIANQLVPWTAEKGAAADAARTQCAAYSAAVNTKLGTMLDTLSALLRCTTYMAKTDKFQAANAADTACVTANAASNGKVEQADIAVNSAGDLPGMCAADAKQCLTDILSINATSLGNSDIPDINDAYKNLPAPLQSALSNDTAVRQGLRTALSN